LLAANYSVPILWLSLFNADGLVTWPGIRCSAFTAVVQPAGECIERSRTRLERRSRRWPDVFTDTSGRWLGYLGAVQRAYLAVGAGELSWMDGEENGPPNSAPTSAASTIQHRSVSVRRSPRVPFTSTGANSTRPALWAS